MPAQSILSKDEKAKVTSAIPKPNNKIFTASLARIYYAYPNPNDWSYSGLQGGLAFIKDASGTLHLKLVDLDGTRGIVWEHELYDGMEYFQDRPYFHSFPGDECMIGFVFADETEAKVFFKKVNSNKSGSSTKSKSSEGKKKAKPAKGGKINKSMISGPTAGSFKHIAHMGYDAENGFTSTNVDPSWNAFLGQLESQGIDREVIAQNMDFIKDFVRDAQKTAPKQLSNDNGSKKKPPPPPVPRRGHNGSASIDSQASFQAPEPVAHKPLVPPAPPVRAPPVRASPVRAPPPSRTPDPPRREPPAPAAPAPPTRPPAPPRPHNNTPSTPAAPPPPPVRAPAPPSRPSVPPPPPRPQSSAPSSVPPVPVREPEVSAPPAPPPPPPPPGPSLPPAPTAGDPRSALLASIQGKGIHNLKPTSTGDAPTRAPPAPVEAEETAAGGGDITSALARALNDRNKRMGGSDDEDDDDDSWE